MKQNIAIIGCGVISSHYLAALKTSNRFSLVATSDINENCYSRQLFSFVPFYTDYKQMLKTESIDIVIISVSVKNHCEVAICAMEMGISVFIEKPMVQSLEELLLLHKKAEENHVILKGMFHWMFADEVIYLKKHLAEFGKISKLTVCIKDNYAAPSCVIRPDRRSLSGSWYDSGVNALSFLQNVFEFTKMAPTYQTLLIDEESNQDYYSRHDFTTESFELSIIVDWREETDAKTTTIESDKGIFVIDHTHQRILLNNHEIYQSIVESRLDSHYINLFDQIDLKEDSKSLEILIHTLLFKGAK